MEEYSAEYESDTRAKLQVHELNYRKKSEVQVQDLNNRNKS